MDSRAVTRAQRTWPLLSARPRGGSRTALICGGLALVLYVVTCAPGVGWQDSAIHQFRIVTGHLENDLGLALSHPLHYWLGRALLRVPLPLGESAYRLNLLSALCGAAGVGLLAALVLRLTRSAPAALFAALSLGLAHSYWQMSVITETYTLAAALMLVEWHLLLSWARRRHSGWLIALFAVNGLHVADHPLGLLTLVTYVVLVLERALRRRLHPVWLLACAAAWVVTTAPYWTLALDFYQRTGDLAATLQSALFGGGGGAGSGWISAVLNVTPTVGQLKLAILSLGYSFPTLTVPLAVAGMFRRARRRRAVFRRVLLGQTILICGFVLRYDIQDLYTFFVPVCALLSLWFGLAVDWLWRSARGGLWRRVLLAGLVVNALLPPAVYLTFPRIGRERGWMRARMRDIPGRDEYAHFFTPWRCGDHSTAVFAREALRRTGPGGWLLADGTTAYTVALVAKELGGPQDLRIYAATRCVNERDLPPLTPAAVQAACRRGGSVVIVGGVQTETLWGPHFELDRRDAGFWYIQGPAAPGTQAPTGP